MTCQSFDFNDFSFYHKGMEKKLISCIQGKIVRGKGAGHKHGMPTANLDFGNQELPEYGVYGGLAYVDDEVYMCITNVGLRPSDDNSPKVTFESLLLDFSGDLYGKEMKVELYFYLRGIRKFTGGLDELKLQLQKDAEKTRELFAQCDDIVL